MCQNFPRVSTSPLFQSFEWLHIRVDTMICTVIDVCLNNDLLLNFIWWWCYKICSLVWWTLIKSNTVRLNSWTKNDSYICVKLKGHIIKYQLNWNIGIWIDPPILFTSCPGGWLTCDLPVTICMLCACVPLLLAGSCVMFGWRLILILTSYMQYTKVGWSVRVTLQNCETSNILTHDACTYGFSLLCLAHGRIKIFSVE